MSLKKKSSGSLKGKKKKSNDSLKKTKKSAGSLKKKPKSPDSLKKTKKSAGSLKKDKKSPETQLKKKKSPEAQPKKKKSPDSIKKTGDSKSKSSKSLKSKSKSISKSKTKSHSKSLSKSKPKSKPGSSGKEKSQSGKKTKPNSKKSSRSNRSNRSIGVGGHPKSLSSRKSAYQQSVGRTIHPKAAAAATGGTGSGSNGDNNGSGSSADSLTMLNWMMYTSLYGERLYDTIQLIFTCHCGTHRKVALTEVDGRGLYLPFCPIKHGQSWMDAIGQFIQGKLLRENVAKLPPDVSAKLNASGSSSGSSSSSPSSSSSSSSMSSLSPTPFTTEPILVELLRVQLPLYLDFVVRSTYRIQLTSAACKAKLCADNSIIGWYPAGGQLKAALGKNPLFGPEPQLMIHPNGKVIKLEPSERCREVAITELFAYQCIDELREQKIGATGTTKDDILRAFGDYLQHVYPSEFMHESSFGAYLKRANLKITGNVSGLFRAFAARERSYIDFEEFIIGLLIVGRLIGQSTSSTGEEEGNEQNIPPPPAITHTAATMKLMADFAYRYYAVHSKHMSSEELEAAAKAFQIADDDVLKLKKEALAHTEHIGSLKRADFVKLLAEKYLPKTSTSETPPAAKLFELIHDRTPMEQLHVRLAYPEIRRVESDLAANKAMETKLQARLLCENCHQKQYCLAPYNLKMNRAGQMYQPVENKEEDVKRAPLSRRKLENEYFESAFVCNKIMDMLRLYAINAKLYPCVVKKRPKGNLEIKDWQNAATRNDLAPEIFNICEQAQRVISAGPRILKVPSPCYVLGDIHGNFTDLMTFDANLWRSNPYFSSSNMLFLGDYVDRGDYGLECVLYLLCMKLTAPHRVHLLRGNHEATTYLFFINSFNNFSPFLCRPGNSRLSTPFTKSATKSSPESWHSRFSKLSTTSLTCCPWWG